MARGSTKDYFADGAGPSAKTARHGLDPGPTFNCHLPIFPGGMSPKLDEDSKQIMQLEFGQIISSVTRAFGLPLNGRKKAYNLEGTSRL